MAINFNYLCKIILLFNNKYIYKLINYFLKILIKNLFKF